MDGVAGVKSCPACCQLAAYVKDGKEWHQKRCGKVDRKNLMRIHILGGPGSGKTTLARDIGTFLGIEVYELDQIAFTGLDYIERPLPERKADIDCIANRPAWITEGIFIQWTDELLERADIIVWLDHVGWRTCFWRIIRRFIQSALREAKKRRGMEKFARFQDYIRRLRQLTQIFFFTRAYFTAYSPRTVQRIENRLSTAAFLTSYTNKVIHCYEDRAVKAFVDYVHLCHS